MSSNGNVIDEFQARLLAPVLTAVSNVTSRTIMALQSFACEAGFVQIMPVLLSPLTDPLNHKVYPAEIEYEGRRLKLTASMIFHKQLALALLRSDKIFILSPNIRLELASVKNSANHLLEFSQFDLEMRGASMHQVIGFVDRLVRQVVAQIKADCSADLNLLGRRLPDYSEPFPIYSSEELRNRYGAEFENEISARSPTPCFVTNFKREFYDRETPGRRGQYNNFDLIYPEGYGEAMSGAEREFEYEQILYRMNELGMTLTSFDNYLEASRRGLIPSTAGAGLGIQRLVKFICGCREIRDVCLFDRSVASHFVF